MDSALNLLFIFLVGLPLLSKGHARPISETTSIVTLTPIVEAKANATDLMRPLENVEEEPAQPLGTTIVKHRRPSQRANRVAMPFDLHTLHLPCDWDHRGLKFIVPHMPNHCIWVFNNRFQHVEFYRIFKTYQLEGFFFGQFYERLKRYEIDPHNFGFNDI